MEQNAFIKKLKLQSGDLKSALKHKVWQFMKRYDWIQASVSTSLDLTREIEQETSHPSVLSLSVLKYLCGSKSCLLGDEGDLADAVTEGWRARSWREGVCVCVWLEGWHLWASLDSVTRCQPVCDSTLVLVTLIIHSRTTCKRETDWCLNPQRGTSKFRAAAFQVNHKSNGFII